MFINVSVPKIYYLKEWIGDLDMEYIYIYQKKLAIRKKDDRPSHQGRKLFIVSKRVGLSLDIRPSRKFLKGLQYSRIST